MTKATSAARLANAGVTLIEMLVVLTLFAVVSGAVVMSLPAEQAGLSSEVGAVALASDINHATGVALATGQGFAIAVDGNEVRFLQRATDGAWHAHADPRLDQVKLFPVGVRISDQAGTANAIFAVSPTLVPDQSQPLRLQFGGAGAGSVLTFDGTAVRVDHGEGH